MCKSNANIASHLKSSNLGYANEELKVYEQLINCARDPLGS